MTNCIEIATRFPPDWKPLFPELVAPDWYDGRHNDRWGFQERGPRLLAKCRRAIGVNRKGDMLVKFGIKREAVLRYTPAACAFYNRKFALWAGLPVTLDYENFIQGKGLVLQSPCRQQRLFSLYGLDDCELKNCEIAPGIELITKGWVNVKGWQCANRSSSYGGEMPPVLLHVLRNGQFPDTDERLDCEPTLNQQLRYLWRLYKDALFEAFETRGIESEERESHTAEWRAKADTHLANYLACGGQL